MAIITGTDGSDVLIESGEEDTIDGLDGDDIVHLGLTPADGVETADGGAGNDRLVLHGIRIFLPNASGGGFISYYEPHTLVRYSNFENYTVYHETGEIGDTIFAGNGADRYYFTATNNANAMVNGYSVADLGGGSDDLLSVDASGVIDYAVHTAPQGGPGRYMMSIGGTARISYSGIERLELIGGAFHDIVNGLSGRDIVDGRDGNDVINGFGGDDRLTGGNGNDALDGGEGNDTLVFTTGTDTVQGGNGIDRLEIDARGQAGAVLLSVTGGPVYAGTFSWAGGSVDYAGIESFTIFSNPGSHADTVVTGAGDDVFHHYGLNDLSYAMDMVDLGGGDDLLVLNFATVTSHVVSNRVHPSAAGHYLFDVGGFAKVDYTGVERIDFLGGAQGDTVTGLAGDDVLHGSGGDDSLTGGDGDDDITGGIGTNSIDAGNDDDIIRSGNLGIDTVQGGAGTDTAIIDYSTQTAAIANIAGGDIAFGNGSDTSVTLTGVERIVIFTGSGDDSIVTADGDDEIHAGAGTDSLESGAGNDLLDGGAGADAMTGGDGDDLYVVDDPADSVTELSGEGDDFVYASSASYVLPANVETLVALGGIGHSFRGNSGNNSLTGEAGADTLLLQDGGVDTARGRSGNDLIYFGSAYTGDDFADGGAGRDSAVLQGNYTVALSGSSLTGFESISLQSGANATWGDIADNFYDYDVTADDSLVPAGVQLIVNGQSLRLGEDLTFDGSAETDGSFLVYAGHGVDTLQGGGGADIFYFEGARFGASDTVDGGAGRDAVVISAGSGLNSYTFGASTFTGIESISVSNRYTTDPTQTPSYALVLHNGNVAAGGNLIVNGSKLGSTQTLSVDGSAVAGGSLTLYGGAGTDALEGGSGADTLHGAGGGDDLTGGGGADRFQYRAASESAVADPDSILDFEAGTDKVDLGFVDADSNMAGNQAFSFIGSNAFGNVAGQLRAYESAGTWFVEGDVNGDGVADFAIAVATQGGAPLAQGDFIL